MPKTKKPKFFQKIPLSWLIYLLVIIVCFVGLYFSAPGPLPDEPAPEPVIDEPVGDLSITAQTAGSQSVTLNDIQVTKPGFIAIHKNTNGHPGPIIGQSEYLVINQDAIQINLAEPLAGGEVFFAVMHQDDGNAVFDPATDLPLTDSQGVVILKTFTAN